MKLSVVIPAHNEAGCIGETVDALADRLRAEGIDHEIVVVADGCTDDTVSILEGRTTRHPGLRIVLNGPAHGFGLAVRRGLEAAVGDAVAVYMADASDRPEDLVRYWRTMQREGVDCVFGSRFSRGGEVVDYPTFKRVINRIVNTGIRLLFGLRYNDVTNAFKLYRRDVVQGVQPLLSHHFNLTVEIPLKAIVRGYSYAVVPNVWINRKTGVSKLKLHEMGSRYLFIVLYCLLEKWLSRGDYRRSELSASGVTVEPLLVPAAGNASPGDPIWAQS